MPWTCYPIKSMRRVLMDGGSEIKYMLPDGSEVSMSELKPGAMFRGEDSPPYTDGHPCFRNGIVVLLPGRVFWEMNQPGSKGVMWQVSGEIPNVSALPSIDFVGIYHGFVTNGVISEDHNGRKFDEMGKRTDINA